ncbi:MAG: nodulation protein NfeD [Marinilabiliaceae bacterium]|nr:nodulation protein NfeD [Marinilabiliaceae bacterium]
MRHIFLLTIFLCVSLFSSAKKSDICVLSIFDEINSSSWEVTKGAFEMAEREKADIIILHINTYGGELVYADSIRTRILNSRIPVYAFIDNNAASAGALISIACDSIYMRSGGSIGAATVVDQQGTKQMDKYQSYMRSMMRSTAETNGRDPRVAEAMVDEAIQIEGLIDSLHILTLTSDEAIANGYCEGKAEKIDDVAQRVCTTGYTIKEYQPTTLVMTKGFLGSTVLRGILILLILGGIYFELQTPGIGFPICVSIVAAILYFAPLYIDGLAANWEILLFIIGLILLALEILVIPGFGIAGISGIVFMFVSLTTALLNNDSLDFSNVSSDDIATSLTLVSLSIIIAIIACIILAHYFFSQRAIDRKSLMVLSTTQKSEDGYVGTDEKVNDSLIGQTGTALTDLRPSGKVDVNGISYDAMAERELIRRGTTVTVVSISTSQVVVRTSSHS